LMQRHCKPIVVGDIGKKAKGELCGARSRIAPIDAARRADEIALSFAYVRCRVRRVCGKC
jgi:hypothetical protein